MDLAGKTNLFYQPFLTKEELISISKNEFTGIRPNFTNSSLASQQSPGFGTTWFPRSERICIDRLEMIVNALPNKIREYSFIDFGCSNGFFINSLSYLGARPSMGLDNSIHNDALKFNSVNVIDKAKQEADAYGLDPIPEFIDCNFITWLEKNPTSKYDVSIFFSVFHHFFKGYGSLNKNDRKGHSRESDLCNLGDSGAGDVLRRIDNVTGQYLIFEMDEQYVPGWNKATIPGLICKYTTFTKTNILGVSDGFTPRTVFIFSR